MLNWNKEESWITLDKQLHWFGGLILSSIFGLLFQNSFIGLFITCIIGLLKEVYDSFYPDKHTSSMKDFIVTTIGGIFGMLFVNMVFIIKR